MKIFHYEEIEAKETEKGNCACTNVRRLITKEMGAENFTMRLFELERGGFSPFHSHPWEHEVFILEGEGLVVGEEKEKKFRAGTVIFISPNEKHQFKNTGEKIVRFLCLVPFHE